MKARYYSPQISRVLVCALYHEAKRRRTPMTSLTNELLAKALDGTNAMEVAKETLSPGNYQATGIRRSSVPVQMRSRAPQIS
jgi:hypothetical protein